LTVCVAVATALLNIVPARPALAGSQIAAVNGTGFEVGHRCATRVDGRDEHQELIRFDLLRVCDAGRDECDDDEDACAGDPGRAMKSPPGARAAGPVHTVILGVRP
jgi:hypothetical protein